MNWYKNAQSRFNAIIVHGWEGSPNEPALQWIKSQLEKLGYAVEAPVMPDTDNPKIEPWVETILSLNPNQNTILIGHSIGAQAVLRYLEKADKRVKAVILLAGFLNIKDKEAEKLISEWVNNPIDFERIKNKASQFAAIFSKDDPDVSVSNAKIFKDKLGADIMVLDGYGHFSPSDNVEEIPEVLEVIKNLI